VNQCISGSHQHVIRINRCTIELPAFAALMLRHPAKGGPAASRPTDLCQIMLGASRVKENEALFGLLAVRRYR
jgi:hypothetical protein